jgi:uncharacterized protein (UPF0212 family)
MGVDYYACNNCGKTFNDCGDYATCETCGHMLCPRCMDKFGVGSSMVMPNNDSAEDGYDPCPFCTKKIVSNITLLGYALVQLGMTKEELIKKYKEEKE